VAKPAEEAGTGSKESEAAAANVAEATEAQDRGRLSSKHSCIAVADTVWAISPFQSSAQQILAALQK